MTKNILVVDDDVDFNSLLTDVFKQAEYIITSALDPLEAVEIFRNNEFDLVVTDHAMPNLTGTEFLREIKKIRKEVPVVMVSGYLDKKTIREVVKAGVESIFLKPLNIFSLLKKTQELIGDAVEEAEAKETGQTEENSSDKPAGKTRLLFKMRSFPGHTPKSLEFADQLYAARNFQSSLLLVGEEGSQFESIGEDLRDFDSEGKEKLYFLRQETFSEAALCQEIYKLEMQSSSRITVVVSETEKMGTEEKTTIYRLAKKKAPFDGLSTEVRFVFCIRQDLDTLFDNGQIDESFYLFAGTSELFVPPLKECRDDIPDLAQHILMAEAEHLGLPETPIMEGNAIDYLMKRISPTSYADLKELLLIAMKMGGSALIQTEELKYAKEFRDLDPKKIDIENLQEYVNKERTGFTKAVYTLLSGGKGLEKEATTTSEAHTFAESKTRQ